MTLPPATPHNRGMKESAFAPALLVLVIVGTFLYLYTPGLPSLSLYLNQIGF